MNHVDNFTAKYKIDESGCWLWLAGINGRGYGNYKVNGKTESSHRVAWEMFVGEIPSGLFVLHSCDVKLCVNPCHLFLGTHGDNMRDMYRKGRAVLRYGSDHHNSKLTEKQVLEIRQYRKQGLTCEKIANIFNVSTSLIGGICSYKRWSWLQ